MTPERNAFFSALSHELSERGARSTVSQLAVNNRALREHLLALLSAGPGTETSFVAKAVFENMFEWERTGRTLPELGLVQAQLAENLAKPFRGADALFPRDRHPYVHQITAWRALLEPIPKSVVVRTGTSSGKTEAFLVPILDSLAGELEANHGRPLVGTRAIFLYPLNALIDSQKDRLLAGTGHYGDKLRFCLYNGNTPNRLREREQLDGPEVKDRTLLRAEPPPLLVTNATMLEYMLVRRVDQPILARSQGQLRWVVLDEAHTYLGTAAAELALLIRRVLHAFGTEPRQVRFIATSATIGDEGRDPDLAQFLADLAGIDKSQVVVVGGRRQVPGLPTSVSQLDNSLPSASVLAGLSFSERATALASSTAFRAVRTQLGKDVADVEDLGKMLGIADPEDVLRLLDLATEQGVEIDGAALLPLRGHYYQRTQPGLWACINPGCTGRRGTALDSPDWTFGRLLLARRERCPDCESLVGEIVICNQCGETYIYARDEQGKLSFPDWSQGSGFDEDDDSDDPLADDDDDEEGEDDGAARDLVLLSRESGSRGAIGAAGSPRAYDPRTGFLGSGAAQTWFAPSETGVRRCGHCGEIHREQRMIFRGARLGVPFYLRTAEHTLAEFLPPADNGTGMMPARGRRLITFTDSRQGTAKHALNSQLQSERMWTRATIYHQLWDATLRRGDGSDSRVAKLREERDGLEKAYRASPQPVLESLLSQKEAELAAASGLTPATISWRALKAHLETEPTVQRFMTDALRSRYAPANMDANALADLCLLREFFRRPPRMNTLETLGLAKLIYPRLGETVANAPSQWLERGASRERWLEFLGFALDFFVRANSAVEVTSDALRWMGVLFSPRLIVKPGEVRQGRAIPWPTLSRTQLSRVTRTLLTALQLDRTNQEHQGIVNALLTRGWQDVVKSPYLKQYEQGCYRLVLQECEISPVSDAWLCPTTGRVLAHTVLDYSPFGQDRAQAPKLKCQSIKLPRPAMAYPNGDDRVHRWLSEDPLVNEVRKLGVWSEFSDRIALFDSTTYLQTAEHSAQVERTKLQRLEAEFKAGRVNVLHCSTTMEMGVDIGGLSAVLMNNVPPAPANYIQRAGRAGRRRESRAAVVTLCPANAHGSAVFANPMWPFRAAVRSPQVALTSYRIVQRHVHSLLLGCFLRSLQGQSGEKLICRDFFMAITEDGKSLANQFAAWIEQPTEGGDVSRGFNQLTACTPLVGQESRCLQRARENLSLLETGWRDERDALIAELAESGGSEAIEWAAATPVQRAILIQLRRHDGEFLLRFLASRGYLPAYGFPLSVLPLVTTTAEELKHERQRRDENQGNTEERSARRTFPSRSLERALTEYAPGRDVVINGVVRQPQGVTLTWRIPAGDQQGSEPQSLRYFWRCKACGDVGDSRVRQVSCSRCGDAVTPTRYLEPAGFAVDVRSQPKNATRSGKLMFGAKPIVSATGASWQALPNAEVGQYRGSSDGWVFHYVRGEYNCDYVVCRHCGWTDALEPGEAVGGEPRIGRIPASFMRHRRLRGGKQQDEALCPGASAPDQYGVWKNLALGGSNRTDVFELTLRDPGQPTQPLGGSELSKTVATSIAVALREALSRELGIDPRELGWSVTRAHGVGDGHRVIALYDTADGGAGYSTQAGEHLPELLHTVRKVLACPSDCDKACHACLLTFDTQRVVERLDRRAALKALTDDLLRSLVLPSDAKAFGELTSAEFRTLAEAFLAFRQRRPVQLARVYWSAAVEDWDWHTWWLRPHLGQLVLEQATVEIVVPSAAVKALNWQESQQLSRQLEGAGFALRIADPPKLAQPGWQLALELEGGGQARRWAFSDTTALTPDESWGSGGGSSRCVRDAPNQLPALQGQTVQPRTIEKPTPGTAEVIELAVGKSSLSRFGSWFAERTFGILRTKSLRFPTDSPLRSVEYSDRYLRSPLVACLLRGVVSALKEYGLHDGTSIEVHTLGDPEYRPSSSLSHNWTQPDIQRAVIEAQLKTLGCTPNVKLATAKRAIGHERVLLLAWENGEQRRITLDQGLGFVRSAMQRFDFSLPAAEQVRRLNGVDVLLTIEEPTRLWVEAL